MTTRRLFIHTGKTDHQSLPPVLSAVNPRSAAALGHAKSFWGPKEPDIDLVTTEVFVDNLNARAFALSVASQKR